MSPKANCKYIAYYNRGKELFNRLISKYIYGLIKSSFLFYMKLWINLKCIGCEINSYDIFMANGTVKVSHMKFVCHVYYLKIYHKFSE